MSIVVDEVESQIIGLADLNVIDAISMALSFSVPGSQYTFQFKSGKWDGRERLLTKQLKFPSGLVPRVVSILKSFSIDCEIQNRIKYPNNQYKQTKLTVKPYPYQEKVINTALDKKGGTIRVATGGGKSIIIACLAAALDVQAMIYVVSLDLLSQLKNTIENILQQPIGMIGAGVCDIRKITVCSVWTAGLACGEMAEQVDSEDVQTDYWQPSTTQRGQIVAAVRSAKAVMLDESQFAAAASIRMILKNSVAAAYKYGFSATPWRTSGDDILLEAAFGEKICDISATDLINQGYLVPPKIFFRDMPKYHTKLSKKWPAVKSRYIVNNEIRNIILVNNIKKLVSVGRKPLALFREIKHGQILFDILSQDFRVKMVNGLLSLEERNQIKAEFESGQVDIILASSVYDQGLDLPALDALVLCAGGKSTAKALQRIGRVIRTNPSSNKKDAIVVDTFDQVHHMRDHSFIRLDIYKTEPGFWIKMEPSMTAAEARRGFDE